MDFGSLYIFNGLSEAEISYFEMMSQRGAYKKGQYVIRQGDDSNGLAYIIISGKVRVVRDGEQTAILGEGDLFGEIALIINEPRTATVTALENVELLELRKDDFLMLYRKSGKYQEIKDNILERIKNNFYGIRE